MTDKKRLTISLDAGDHAALQHLADREERSLNYLIVQAVKYYLEAVRTSENGRAPREQQTRLRL